ncbi:MAG: hypothetical protein Q8O16_04070 [Dehalococcoidia bacterium]|nr:hypothetical protein [Dehalococcoidia bacterium]
MWDLEQIIEQNNQAALDYMMRGLQVEEAQSPQPEAWALSLLADILKVGPPLLSEIIECLQHIDNQKEFLSLVRMLLPEHETEIMAETKRRRVYKFCFYFGKKYYRLPANTECSTSDWIAGMPVELLAMSYSSYHELDMRPGYLLLLSLVIYPYEGDERDLEEDELGDIPDGARVPLLDLVQNMVGAELVNRIPAEGWDPVELHRMTDKTPYDGVGDFADWVCSQTECVMLDASYENCDYQEGVGEPIFRWTKRNVAILTEQWPKVKRIRRKIDHIVEWLEADQINHFAELLEFLLKSQPAKTKKRKYLYDPMEHICQLDQDSGEEGR